MSEEAGSEKEYLVTIEHNHPNETLYARGRILAQSPEEALARSASWVQRNKNQYHCACYKAACSVKEVGLMPAEFLELEPRLKIEDIY